MDCIIKCLCRHGRRADDAAICKHKHRTLLRVLVIDPKHAIPNSRASTWRRDTQTETQHRFRWKHEQRKLRFKQPTVSGTASASTHAITPPTPTAPTTRPGDLVGNRGQGDDRKLIVRALPVHVQNVWTQRTFVLTVLDGSSWRA